MTGCSSSLKQVTGTGAPAGTASAAPGRNIKLTASMQQIRLLAKISDAYNHDDLRTAYQLLQQIDPHVPVTQSYRERLAVLGKALLERWSLQLIEQARSAADQHLFTGAVALLDEMPAESPHLAEARQLQDEIRQQGETYLRVKEEAQEQRDRLGRERLQQALHLGKDLQFAPALKLLHQVPATSDSHEAALAKLGQYERLLRQREQWRSGGHRSPVLLASAARPHKTQRPHPGNKPGPAKRPINWEQWRFQQWKAEHKRYNIPSQMPQSTPLLRPALLWPTIR